MKPTLRFEECEMLVAELGEESSVPDLYGQLNLQQSHTEFDLEETDEIYEGYGRCFTSYPYRQNDGYTSELKKKKIKLAVLENQYLRAEFLTEFGGRLWTLFDKEKGENLLYTNDVLQFRNLAICNAWFSGGVEWNMGLIGHTPYTVKPIYVSELEYEGHPVLRMYEYERIRNATYQMDFWLEEDSRFLNCRMRIVNSGTDVIPMYWWSNMAVPEFEGGRIIVPAWKAFTSRKGKVYKTDIPIVDGVDITRYENIPWTVDYFFDLDKSMPAYIANVNKNGYGLLHLSTKRLQSRKLFSWGNNEGSDRWQEFLTKDAGRYIEIQAGVGKTQYGCIPMAPHTAWEWMEQYGSIQLSEEELEKEHQELWHTVAEHIICDTEYGKLEETLKATKEMAKTPVDFIQCGSVYGSRRNQCKGTEHLKFVNSKAEEDTEGWSDFWQTGILREKDPDTRPEEFAGEAYFELLEKAVCEKNKDNWYAHYQLGLLEYQKKQFDDAERSFLKSVDLKENAWAYHALACLYLKTGKREKASEFIQKGMKMQREDTSYIKEGIRLLDLCEENTVIIKIYETLPENQKRESRIRLFYVKALHAVGRAEEAFAILNENGGWVPDDFREGEVSVEKLWDEIQVKLTGNKQKVPHVFCFSPSEP